MDTAKLDQLAKAGHISPEVYERAKNSSLAQHLGSAIRGGISDTASVFKSAAGAVAEPIADFGRGLMGSDEVPPQDVSAGTGGIQQVSAPAVADGHAPSQVTLASDVAHAPAVVDPIDSKTPGMEMMSGAFGKQKQAIGMAANAQSEQAEKTASLIDDEVQSLQRLQDKQTVRQAEQDKQYGEWVAKRDEALAEFKEMEVDPGRLWRNMSTGNKVLAGIGLALGSFGGARGNTAVEVIKGAIDTDIAAQKANIAKAGETVKEQGGILAEMRAKFGDDRMAEAATRNAYLDQMKLKISGIEQRHASPLIKANALKAVGMIEQEQAKTQVEFDKALQAKMAQMRLMGGNATQTDVDIMNLPDEQRKDYMARRVRADGVDGFAGTSERAKVLQESVTTTQNNRRMVKDLLSLGSKEGRQFIPSEVKAQAQVLQAVLKGGLRTEIVGPGAMNESEMKLLDDVVANPTLVMQANARAALLKLDQVLERNMQGRLKGEGIQYKKLSTGAPVN